MSTIIQFPFDLYLGAVLGTIYAAYWAIWATKLLPWTYRIPYTIVWSLYGMVLGGFFGMYWLYVMAAFAAYYVLFVLLYMMVF
jgi:hypothetical protein